MTKINIFFPQILEFKALEQYEGHLFKENDWTVVETVIFPWASLVAQTVKRLPAMRETRVWFLGREDPLEKEVATHSSILAWRIPWTEEPGSLQSMGSQRVWHNRVTEQQQQHVLGAVGARVKKIFPRSICLEKFFPTHFINTWRRTETNSGFVEPKTHKLQVFFNKN